MVSEDALEQNARLLEGVLEDFGVRGEIINVRPGPVVTLYELEPAPGIKSSRVIGLADDIARSMSAHRRRASPWCRAATPSASSCPTTSARRSICASCSPPTISSDTQAKLPLCLGKTIGGEPVIVDLARMPHLLIAGTTGSGKSVAINTMILSLLYRLTPEQCRLIMVDPKMLELSVYDGIPHLLTPVVTDPKKAVVALKWAVREMEERYKKMSKLGVRNIDGYNARARRGQGQGRDAVSAPCRPASTSETGEAIYEKEELDLEPLPYIVVIVDEMADLMMVAGKDIEGAVQRLAQMARAAGIHVDHGDAAPVGRRHHRHHQGELPDPHLLPGHLQDRQPHHPGRAGRRAAARPGRHALHGRRRPHQPRPRPVRLRRRGREGRPAPQVAGPAAIPRSRHRGRGARRTRTAIRSSTPPAWARPATPPTSTTRRSQVVHARQKASTSYIQRRLQIGYNRAASLMERMEKEGIVGQANHAGKREILVGQEEHERVLRIGCAAVNSPQPAVGREIATAGA